MNGGFARKKEFLASPSLSLILSLLLSRRIVLSRESYFQGKELRLKKEEANRLKKYLRNHRDDLREIDRNGRGGHETARRSGVETHGWLGVRTTVGNRMEKQE